MSRCSLLFLCAAYLCCSESYAGMAVPYASRVRLVRPLRCLPRKKRAHDVSFILNEPADQLGYRINGGPLTWLDGSTSGAKSFPLTSLSDTFEILVNKTDTVGYTIPTGATIPASVTAFRSRPTSRLQADQRRRRTVLTRFNCSAGRERKHQSQFARTLASPMSSNSAAGSRRRGPRCSTTASTPSTPTEATPSAMATSPAIRTSSSVRGPANSALPSRRRRRRRSLRRRLLRRQRRRCPPESRIVDGRCTCSAFLAARRGGLLPACQSRQRCAVYVGRLAIADGTLVAVHDRRRSDEQQAIGAGSTDRSRTASGGMTSDSTRWRRSVIRRRR